MSLMMKIIFSLLFVSFSLQAGDGLTHAYLDSLTKEERESRQRALEESRLQRPESPEPVESDNQLVTVTITFSEDVDQPAQKIIRAVAKEYLYVALMNEGQLPMNVNFKVSRHDSSQYTIDAKKVLRSGFQEKTFKVNVNKTADLVEDCFDFLNPSNKRDRSPTNTWEKY